MGNKSTKQLAVNIAEAAYTLLLERCEAEGKSIDQMIEKLILDYLKLQAENLKVTLKVVTGDIPKRLVVVEIEEIIYLTFNAWADLMGITADIIVEGLILDYTFTSIDKDGKEILEELPRTIH